MLTAEQIQEKILGGESSGVEFKHVELRGDKLIAPKRDDLSDEIAAFANSDGGVILFGVDDGGNITEVHNPSALGNALAEIMNDSIKPPIQYSYMESMPIVADKGVTKRIFYIEIMKSLWVHQSAGGCFYRQGPSKRAMSIEQIARLAERRSRAVIIPFCERPVPQTNINTLSPALWKKFINVRSPEDVLDPANPECLDKLRKRKLVVKNQKGQDAASVAGALMCCRTPRRYLTKAYIQAVCYRGATKDANYQVDAKDFDGPLNEQIMDAFYFVDKHNQVSASKEIGREERRQYSMRAVFEAIVNAVVHRDYSIYVSKIRLFLFANRLEIYSPGALANNLTVDTLEYHQIARNELLAKLLTECFLRDEVQGVTQRKRFLEERGEGVGIIYRESEQLSGKKPVYQVHGEQLLLTIFAADSLSKQ